MSTVTSQKTKFWVLCCEETEATQKISKAVADWQLPGVRSRLGHQLPLAVAAAIAHADYALFVTPYRLAPHHRESLELSITPLSITQSINSGPMSPASLLATVHNHYGKTPQSWWAQLPTELTTQQTVDQALSKIKEFVRPYAYATTTATHRGHSSVQPQWRNCRKAYRI
ncbi:MAG: hypothetical protein AAFQ40_07000 [Cyanobacteria bacterium J06623_5]